MTRKSNNTTEKCEKDLNNIFLKNSQKNRPNGQEIHEKDAQIHR